MTTPLTSVPVRIPATMNIPSDTEIADSSSLALFAQVLLNGVKYATELIEQLTVGGNVTPTGDVHWNQNALSGLKIEIDQTQFLADGSMYTGNVNQLRKLTAGAAGGTTLYLPDCRLVHFLGSGMGAAIWKIDDPADAARIGSCITFYNASNPTCVIQHPMSATTLATIGAGGVLGVECIKYAAGSWMTLPTYHA